MELLSAIVKRKPKERAALLEDIARGDVDVIVGTHALLSPSVRMQSVLSTGGGDPSFVRSARRLQSEK